CCTKKGARLTRFIRRPCVKPTQNRSGRKPVMSALTIFIIRHAEKPGESWPGPGLTPTGVTDKKSLVIRGWQRAGSWAALFGGGFNSLDYPRPSVIYAADPNAIGGDEPSQRPF